MKNRVTFKNIFLANLIFALAINSSLLKAEPWEGPGNLLIRHDIHLLVDSGVLNIPVTTWPLSWGDIAYNLSKNESEMTLIELASYNRVKELLMDVQKLGVFGKTEVKFSNNPKQIKSFNEVATNSSSFAASTSYLSKNIAINLKVEKTPGSSTIDESYLSIARGNYSFTLGSKKNWWGPGWHGSLALSSNASPLTGLLIERNFSDGPQLEYLNWIGPWDLSFLYSKIDNSRKFYGLRVGIRPLQNLEIGLTGTSIGNVKELTCELSECNGSAINHKESSYNLTGLDFRSSHDSRDIPYAFYGQIMSESFKDSMALFGFETWGIIDTSKKYEGYRIYTEATSTNYRQIISTNYNQLNSINCDLQENDPLNYGCNYQELFYEDIYSYKRKNIGHTLGGDSFLMSIGGILIGENSQLYKSSLSIGQLNRGTINTSQLKNNKTNYFNFDLSYQFDLYWFDIGLGSFDLGVGLDFYKNKMTGISENEPRIYLAWVKNATINSSESRNYSDYLELIEVSDKKIIEQTISEDSFSIDQYLLLNDLDLNEIILLVDKVSSDRNDGNPKSNQLIYKNQSFSKPTYNLDIDAMVEPNDLSEYMNLMDQTINERGTFN